MAAVNVTAWEVSPSAGGDAVVSLDIDGVFEFRFAPRQAVQIAAAISTAAKAVTAQG
jgi:hypothetical protein